MPSKRRWALNPRKWFGTISNAAHKREKKNQITNPVIPLPPSVTKTTRTIPSTPIVPRILTSRNKTKVTPAISINDNNYTNSTNTIGSFTQFQLPPFNVNREKTSVLLSSSTLFHRTNTFVPPRTEPSIRKNGQFKEELSITATRRNTELISYDASKLLISSTLSSQYRNTIRRNLIEKPSEMNILHMSDQDLLHCPQDSSNDFIEKTSSPRRSHSSSSLSIDDNDVRDESSSSGVFTDERADINDRHRTASKDTLSTLEVFSVESIGDSQISLNHVQSRPLAHRYRLPLFETIEDKSAQQRSKTSIDHSYRSHSAENLLKDNRIITPVTVKSRQSSAAIVKKIEKRIPTGRSPPVTLEKAGFVRVANATYRLTTDKDDHLYRRQRQNSIIQYLPYEDSLPPADDEESYATLPRTSSTEQLDNNLQNNLRAIVDDCLGSMAASMNKTTSRTIKTHHRSKRSHTNHEHTQINIEDITDKLVSSVGCSTYVQYQRCY